MRFADRHDAGRQLGARLQEEHLERPLVLGLPRGGVPVAAEVARALDAPLDVLIVRKLGAPHQPELAIGAIGEGGVRVVEPRTIEAVGASTADLESAEATERVELERRAERYRHGRPRVSLTGRTVVIVDDGIATGSTARAACRVARSAGASRIVLATPVAPAGWAERFAGEADRFVALDEPEGFHAVGQFYVDFEQTTDDEVVELLAPTAPDPDAASTLVDEEVRIAAGSVVLEGHLTVPTEAPGVVVFAHGSGSSRHSPRNRFVAEQLVDAGLGTLLFDLLTDAEADDRRNVFDVVLLGRRLVDTTEWLRARVGHPELPVAYFGASTGAAAALCAAVEVTPPPVAVVARGGRPDLAGDRLSHVTAPTLLIVGGDDHAVIDLNRAAADELGAPVTFELIPGATHLFEEPGTLEAVAQLACRWLADQFAAADPHGGPAGA
ncbi:MAG: phosphoribosyltransferase [Acidimicrobiia bacterium]|nr:phosphoribosyltransferase [Acidimicrobiia bacterium]